MVTQFFMAMRPPTCTAQEKQVRVLHGKPQFYEPQALAAARQERKHRLLVPKGSLQGEP